MRKLVKALVLVLMPMVVLAACDKKSDAATSSSYDTTPASNARYLADYAAKPGVNKTASGLMYRVLREGKGPSVLRGSDIVTVYY